MKLEAILSTPYFEVDLPNLYLHVNDFDSRYAIVMDSIPFPYASDVIVNSNYPAILRESQQKLTKILGGELDAAYRYIDGYRDAEDWVASEPWRFKLRALPKALKNFRTVKQHLTWALSQQRYKLLLANKIQEIFEKGEAMLKENLPEFEGRKELLSEANDLTYLHRRYVATLEKVFKKDTAVFSILYPV